MYSQTLIVKRSEWDMPISYLTHVVASPGSKPAVESDAKNTLSLPVERREINNAGPTFSSRPTREVAPYSIKPTKLDTHAVEHSPKLENTISPPSVQKRRVNPRRRSPAHQIAPYSCKRLKLDSPPDTGNAFHLPAKRREVSSAASSYIVPFSESVNLAVAARKQEVARNTTISYSPVWKRETKPDINSFFTRSTAPYFNSHKLEVLLPPEQARLRDSSLGVRVKKSDAESDTKFFEPVESNVVVAAQSNTNTFNEPLKKRVVKANLLRRLLRRSVCESFSVDPMGTLLVLVDPACFRIEVTNVEKGYRAKIFIDNTAFESTAPQKKRARDSAIVQALKHIFADTIDEIRQEDNKECAQDIISPVAGAISDWQTLPTQLTPAFLLSATTIREELLRLDKMTTTEYLSGPMHAVEDRVKLEPVDVADLCDVNVKKEIRGPVLERLVRQALGMVDTPIKISTVTVLHSLFDKQSFQFHELKPQTQDGLPNDLLVYWQQYPWLFGEDLCKLRALVSETTSYTSVLTIVAFSTERYLAICHPLHSYAMSGLGRAIRIIGALWLIGFLTAAPFAVYTNVHYVDFPPGSKIVVPESAFCAMLEDDLPPNIPIYELSFLLFFLIPMLIIIALYVAIGLRIRQRSRHSLGKRVEGVIHGESRQKSKTRKSITRMLAAVVVAFFLCWAPFHAQRLLYLYADRTTPYYAKINEWLYYIAGCFYYFSSTINPILYNLMSVRYRLAFRQTLCGYRYERNRSRDLHSSFKETIIHTHGNSHWRRTLTWRQSSKKSIKSNGTDVVVMIAPRAGNEISRRATVNWRKTFLRVALGSKMTKSATSPDHGSEAVEESELNKVGIQAETCI